MEFVWITLALILSVVGIIGSIVPGLPGHPLNYVAVLIVQYFYKPFDFWTVILLGVATVVIFFLDYLIPAWTAKKYGATKQGITGSIIGMVAGMFFTPIGMILGTFLGAVLGDMIAGRNVPDATSSGVGTLFGTLLSIGFKVILSVLMSSMIVFELIKVWM
ncbi:MAG: DUF456 domain-containing protein [Saprospiraceae bacterium]|nr:DUF456 domain-containing protein [Candidatus Vicinibacter proximus]